MQRSKAFIVAVSVLLLSVISQPVWALTFDYNTKAQALVEVVWYGYLGEDVISDYQAKEANNARSYATAYYEETMFSGDNVEISTSVEASVEPNEVVLSAEVTGSYEFDIAWEAEFIKSFYQDANSTAKGWLQINEFPTGAPCSLQIDISFPNENWKATWMWLLYIESSSDYFLAGRDELGDYGFLSGTIDACAGEQIYVFLGIAGVGYADHEIGDALGYGAFTINAALTAAPHLADLSSDGWINFEDFALFSSHWHQQGCEDPNTNWCQQADIDHSGNVDANDLDLFSQYWLLFPDPNQIQ